jgi:predicted transcriptional regulator
MAESGVSEKLRLFIFQYIDSVEIVEVLNQMRSQRDQWQTADEISKVLRSNQSSVQGRLDFLTSLGITEQQGQGSNQFRYQPNKDEFDSVIAELLEEYKVRRHRILEMIFSPAKQVRKFADAFVIGKDSGKKDTTKKEDDHG